MRVTIIDDGGGAEAAMANHKESCHFILLCIMGTYSVHGFCNGQERQERGLTNLTWWTVSDKKQPEPGKGLDHLIQQFDSSTNVAEQ
jgi:hypothetical protein